MKRAAPLMAAALVLAGTACGGANQATPSTPTAETSQTSAQKAVLQAAAKAGQMRSARVSFSAKLSGGAANGTFTGEGAFAGRKARMSMDMSGLANGQITGRMEMVFANLVMYMKFPAQIAQRLPSGTAWIKFDLAQLGKEQGIDFAALFNQFSSSDPTKSLELLRAAQTDFREVGTEKVRNVDTTHYAGTVDLARLAENAPATVRETYRRVIELSGQSRVPVDVWIDDQGRTRRMRYEQKMRDGSSMELTQEYYDFGADVRVAPPPASKVIDITQLIANA
jgi:hypothetical protein